MQSKKNSQLQTISAEPKSLKDAYEHFKASDCFGNLSIASQRSYEYLGQYFPLHLRLSALNHDTIEKALKPLKNRPGLYRRARSGILRLGTYAVANGWLSSPPLHIRDVNVKLGTITRWKREDVRSILDLLQDDKELQMAVALVYYTAQRLADCKRLRPADRIEIMGSPRFRVVQSKTGEEVFPEITPDLEKWLPSDLSSGEHYLKSSESVLRGRFLKRLPSMAEAGKTLHGLRKSASCEVAEGGGTLPELMALLGHRSPSTAAIYFKQADQARLAASAASKRG